MMYIPKAKLSFDQKEVAYYMQYEAIDFATYLITHWLPVRVPDQEEPYWISKESLNDIRPDKPKPLREVYHKYDWLRNQKQLNDT